MKIQLLEYHPAQQAVWDNRARFNVLACGRRLGKTEMLKRLLAETAIEGWPVALFAPNYKDLAETWVELRRTLVPITTSANDQDHVIKLATGGSIDGWTLDGKHGTDAGRGRKYKVVAIDEAAKARNLEEVWNAAIRPTLADYEGSAWFASTPKGLNYFFNLYQLGEDPDRPDWMSARLTTYDNPVISRDELATLRESVSEVYFSQEILAEFVTDAGAVFRGVAAAATAEEEREPTPGHRYVIGVDWGKLGDFSAMVVVNATTRSVVWVDRSNRVDYAVQRQRLTALQERYGAEVIAERNSMGEPILEDLNRSGLHVLPFVTTQASKIEAIEALALAIESGQLSILPDNELMRELQAYTITGRSANGLPQYNAPAGLHDDTVMALAFAWSLIDTRKAVTIW